MYGAIWGVNVTDDTLLIKLSAYVYWYNENDGDSVPLDVVNAYKVASIEILCTTIVYVLDVIPVLAVTIIVIVLSPTFILIELEGLPDVTDTPFIVMPALGSAEVGVIVILDTLLTIELLYEYVEKLKVGTNVPLEITIPDKASLAADGVSA